MFQQSAIITAKKSQISDALQCSFKSFFDTGTLVPITGKVDTPFTIKRLFYVFDSKEPRGHHAHKKCSQILICLKGSIEVTIMDGIKSRVVTLDKPNIGLIIPPGLWAKQSYFSDAILLVLCSHDYDPTDYIKDFEEFKKWKVKE